MPEQDNEYLKAMIAKAAAKGGRIVRVADTPSNLGAGLGNKYIMVVSQPDYDVGDFLMFMDKRGGHTLHPVVGKKPNPKAAGNVGIIGADDTVSDAPPENMYFTKGTFNPVGDGYIPMSKVVGKMARVMGPTHPKDKQQIARLIQSLSMGE